MSAASKRRRGSIVEATVAAVACMAILVGLGVWQLDRKAWKENLIASLTTRLSKAPEPLPPRENWERLTEKNDEYLRVAFPAQFLPGESAFVYTAGSAFRPDVSGPGYWVMTPARVAGGSIVIINRGFVPLNNKEAANTLPPGSVDIVGVLRWPEQRALFTPENEPQNNLWYVRDPKAIAAAKHWDSVAPFYIDMEAPVPQSGWPKPGKLVAALPDNHLQYALTWFGLALALGGVYVGWLARRLSQRG